MDNIMKKVSGLMILMMILASTSSKLKKLNAACMPKCEMVVPNRLEANEKYFNLTTDLTTIDLTELEKLIFYFPANAGGHHSTGVLLSSDEDFTDTVRWKCAEGVMDKECFVRNNTCEEWEDIEVVAVEADCNSSIAQSRKNGFPCLGVDRSSYWIWLNREANAVTKPSQCLYIAFPVDDEMSFYNYHDYPLTRVIVKKKVTRPLSSISLWVVLGVFIAWLVLVAGVVIICSLTKIDPLSGRVVSRRYH